MASQNPNLSATRHILLLDDVNLMCQFLNETLRTIPNVECHTASRIASAEGTLSRVPVSMAIIDLNLPDGSGLDIVKLIRKGEGKGEHDIPILIFSGNTYKEAVTECLQFKVTDFIVKPIVAMELRKRVEMHLNSHKNLEPAQFFQEIDRKLQESKPKPVIKKPTQSVVNNNEDESKRATSVNKEQEVQENLYIKWPAAATTGYHQLDRRLKDLCYHLNHFHFYRTEKDVYPTAEKDVDQIKLCIDDLNYAIKPLRAASQKLKLWKALEERLKIIAELPFKRLSANKVSDEAKKNFSKSLRTAWLGVLTKPIIQRKK